MRDRPQHMVFIKSYSQVDCYLVTDNGKQVSKLYADIGQYFWPEDHLVESVDHASAEDLHALQLRVDTQAGQIKRLEKEVSASSVREAHQLSRMNDLSYKYEGYKDAFRDLLSAMVDNIQSQSEDF